MSKPMQIETTVRVKLCSTNCRRCADHRWSEPLAAVRLDHKRVRITEADPVWQDAVLNVGDYEFVSDAELFLLMAKQGHESREGVK